MDGSEQRRGRQDLHRHESGTNEGGRVRVDGYGNEHELLRDIACMAQPKSSGRHDCGTASNIPAGSPRPTGLAIR